MELASDLFKATAEYDAAFTFDGIDFDKAGRQAMQDGVGGSVGYAMHKTPAKVAVRAAWQNIIVHIRNLESSPKKRAPQLGKLNRAVEFLDEFSWTLNKNHIEHFPDSLASWVNTGKFDFERLENNLNAIASTPPTKIVD